MTYTEFSSLGKGDTITLEQFRAVFSDCSTVTVKSDNVRGAETISVCDVVAGSYVNNGTRFVEVVADSMNYADWVALERCLRALPNIQPVKPYRSDNFMTPYVVGFIPLVGSIRAEISYGEAFGGGYAVGFTLFSGRALLPYDQREPYDKCFFDINQIPAHCVAVAAQLSNG